ncbi:PAS domain-containing sensor histidine kinase [Emticicia sp. BO119]|uniref:PAS domain-containing sensor histidine kinase n=1 Tax=Emticicia sp. BO119 TaxID=2757768 RepID=UPI0015EFF2BB|nr:PAS domain-containing sensor histidine kinase [Emticicia sp. BO119]MBA4848886.1 PAS domain-containing sensor histidine kinase [Emticicia sp. BO119]
MKKKTGSPPTIEEMDILHQSEAIFLFATEGILIADKQGKIVRVNPSGAEMFGYEPEELADLMIEDLIPNRFRQMHTAHRMNFNEHPHARSMGSGMDLYAKRKDGSEFPVEISLSPYQNSKGAYVIAFVIDISIRKIAENKLVSYKNELEVEVEERTLVLKEAIQKLEKTKDELDRALKREQEVNLMKSRFITIASHEFRTPLATVLSSLSLVEKYGDLDENEKRDKHIHRIKSSVRNLTEILNDFLSLNKLEEGKVVVTPESFAINELVDEIGQQMQGIAKKGQRIDCICEALNDSYEVRLDAKLIKNIVINLISNAIKFSPENSSIQIKGLLTDSQVIISIKDEGIGIPEAEKKHVFERFYRMSNAEAIQGTGLGLSIVNQYVLLLKGKIDFTSEVNKGTEFIITLPRYL